MDTGNSKLKDARLTLRKVRSNGHPCVELREDGKALIFFCILCRKSCYGDYNLFNHLVGKIHTKMLATAKATLLKPNPWPFHDGTFFFHVDSEDQNESSHVSDSRHGISYKRVIPAVLQNEEISDLVVMKMGVGRISARFSKKDGVSDGIRRIWCEWLGNKVFAAEDIEDVPEHDFAIVTFSYNYNLGRMGYLDVCKDELPSTPHLGAEECGSSRGKKRKSFSDPVYIHDQHKSSGEESSNFSNSRLSLSDNQQVHTRMLPCKKRRKELRDLKRLASERRCAICQQLFHPEKDVAALLNRITGKLVCSSRNFSGAFHTFHVSCLIHWIMLCEVEIYEHQSVSPKATHGSRKKTKHSFDEDVEKHGTQQICSAFCNECQGTGVTIDDGEELEKPPISYKERLRLQIKRCSAHKAWMRSPESLQNCSMGMTFPLQSDEIYPEYVKSLFLLHFYRAND